SLGALCADVALFGENAGASLAAEIRSALAKSASASIIGRADDDFAPLLLLDGFLYHQRVHVAESRLAERVLALLAAPAPSAGDTRLAGGGPEPQTVHRLLRWSPTIGRFRHHRQNPLAAKVVVVDESSMLDLVLMERLTAALAPDARLVLLGDADQLPSVAAGAVFRDLIAAAASAASPPALAQSTCRLTKSF